ncbi:MAG: hypothetical protein AABY33_07350 [Pseudomonadota bacterium]
MNKFFLLCLSLVFTPINLWAAAPQAQIPAPVVLTADLLTGQQREDYLRIFNNVIENHKTDKPYKWRTGSATGNILVSSEYLSKSDSVCRNFSEGYVINGKAGQAQGVVCRKDDKKEWCRLTYEDARTCKPKEPETEETTDEEDSSTEEE